MYSHFLKRVIDFLLVFCILALIWPILFLVAFWLHFANKGSGVFFTQERPGKDGKIFKVIKFKTMTDERDAEGNLLPDAVRLTKVGSFVRSTSIDELPQLINVLQGGYGFDRSPVLYCLNTYRFIVKNKLVVMKSVRGLRVGRKLTGAMLSVGQRNLNWMCGM